MSDPGPGRRGAAVRSLRVRVSVAVQAGQKTGMYWRKKEASVGTREEAMGWWQ